IDEPIPSERLIDENPDMKDELRRPMMLIISARRK
ncbi:SAM-dependent methyltransferase, partial [Macrococcus lamae]